MLSMVSGTCWGTDSPSTDKGGTTVLLQYDPTSMLLGVHPKELKMYVHTKTCTWMSIEAIFVIIA